MLVINLAKDRNKKKLINRFVIVRTKLQSTHLIIFSFLAF